MISTLIFAFLTYLILTSWIFWALVSALVALVVFAISPLFRVMVTLAFVFAILTLARNLM